MNHVCDSLEDPILIYRYMLRHVFDSSGMIRTCRNPCVAVWDMLDSREVMDMLDAFRVAQDA